MRSWSRVHRFPAAINGTYESMGWEQSRNLPLRPAHAGEGAVFRTVDGEAVAEAVEHRAQGQLRLGVAAADAGHDFRALFRGEYVHGERLKIWRRKTGEFEEGEIDE